jgi:cysteine desulfurase
MIYLDNAATTAPEPAVLETFNKVCTDFWANPHSLHRLGERAEQLIEQARAQVVGILDGKGYRAIFTSGATESNNLALKGIAEQYRGRGNHIVTTNSEHPSVENVMRQLEAQGAAVTRLPVGPDGEVAPDQVQAALTNKTILVSTMFVNNESGAITPVTEIARLLARHPAHYHVDGVQGIGKLPFSLAETPVDLLSISAHKFGGLKGSGALLIRDRLLLAPQLHGGGQEFGLRSGTADAPRAAALAKALRLTTEGLPEHLQAARSLNQLLREGIAGIPGLICNSPLSASPYIVNCSVGAIPPETILHGLAEAEIYISTVSACASKKTEPSAVILALTGDAARARSTIRISLSRHTRAADIQRLLEVLATTMHALR